MAKLPGLVADVLKFCSSSIEILYWSGTSSKMLASVAGSGILVEFSFVWTYNLSMLSDMFLQVSSRFVILLPKLSNLLEIVVDISLCCCESYSTCQLRFLRSKTV